MTRPLGSLKLEPSRGQGCLASGQTVFLPGCFPQAYACLSRTISRVSWEHLSDADLLAPVKV